ncbi:RING finger protein nenya-like isoform X2 [Eupeodes corollae]|uniref:RING finger protein nenya-like isoform X2 n=1 Tax=Eupeodes corollae TaxID=290404 RepID=UPI002493C768|nr:RING finger protein nenya-like isoform X2 [Eupeodes corollae]
MWLHCNKCGVRRSEDKTVKFFILVCSHVLCEECNLAKTCPIHNRLSKGIEISASMPKNMRILVEEPNKLLESWKKCIRFQFEQRSLVEAQEYDQVIQNTRKIKEEIAVLTKYKEAALKNIEKENKCINKMKAYYVKLLRKERSEELAQSGSTLSTSQLSLNTTSSLGESVDMNFDDSNSSN